MVNDRVGDFIIRLQNAAKIGTREVSMPYSTHLFAIAGKLRELGFLTQVKASEETEGKRTLTVALAYNERGLAKLRGVKRVSSPGRRLYTPSREAHSVKGGTGARIISSPSGIISDREARRSRIGGEALFDIW